MKQFQAVYRDRDSFHGAVSEWRAWRAANTSGQALIHIFSDGADDASVRDAREVVEQVMPDAVYVGASASGNIYGGNITTEKLVVTCTLFERPDSFARTRLISIENRDTDSLRTALRAMKGDFVGVKGQFRSHNKHMDEKAGKNRLELRVFAKEVQELDGSREQPQDEIFLDGHLCKPVVFRKTPNGREIADILVAVNRAYGKSDYIPCICWGRTARYVSSMNVGDHVLLWGRIQSRDYFKKGDGRHKRTAFEVSVSRLEMIRETRTGGAIT